MTLPSDQKHTLLGGLRRNIANVNSSGIRHDDEVCVCLVMIDDVCMGCDGLSGWKGGVSYSERGFKLRSFMYVIGCGGTSLAKLPGLSPHVRM